MKNTNKGPVPCVQSRFLCHFVRMLYRMAIVVKTFDNSEYEKYKAEAREKWGKTDAYKEHEERTKNYSGQKWNDLAKGMDRIIAEFALCKEKAKEPTVTKRKFL